MCLFFLFSFAFMLQRICLNKRAIYVEILYKIECCVRVIRFVFYM